ncbi:MAG TPA: ferrochelatase [Steroidobacteraceae bacterium]|nr:ferrochelatase [Steroidobacteraceae bacterium]HNS27319.1 ferrochelatase [Steroidobacteraceae bacterium]
MPQYHGTLEPDHDRSARVGVLLVNSGSPDSASVRDIRRFLGRLLSDPRVVELPRWLWLPILHGIILPIRPLRSARKYRAIFAAGRSPLLRLSHELSAALEAELATRPVPPVSVAIGMMYSKPSVRDAITSLTDAGARRLLVVPLFAQYSGVTTAAACDKVASALAALRWVPELRYVADFHDHPDYIEALRASIAAHWAAHGRSGHLLLSWHGIPSAYCEKGDPYLRRCHATAQLLADALKLREGEWSLAFQSRFGGGRWLRPYTDEVLDALPARGVRTVTVACPGFAVDCLETLEEIDVTDRARFLAAGGKRFDYVPALNARPEHVLALANLVQAHVRGWGGEGAVRGAAGFPRVVSIV